MVKSLYRISAFIALSALLLMAAACVKPPETELPTPAPEPEPLNTQPVINYVTAEKEVVPGAEVEITCVSTDADGDALTFTWTADGGTITNDAGVATWTAPEAEGTYTVDVVVSDGKGGEASEAIVIAVTPRPNNAPEVTLFVTRDIDKEPIEVTGGMNAIRMKRWSTAKIQAVATDPDGDELSYKWYATAGEVRGLGSEVSYIATETHDQTVVVTVIDSRGAEIKTAVYFDVPCCGQQ